MIRNFLNARNRRMLHMHVEREEFGVLIGDLCHDGLFYRATLVEVWPGVYVRSK
jgi:hypothetical protein